MRTNIDLNDALLAEAMEFTGLPTKKATVEAALQQLVTGYRQQRAIEELRGMGWEGDLETMRLEGWRPPDLI